MKKPRCILFSLFALLVNIYQSIALPSRYSFLARTDGKVKCMLLSKPFPMSKHAEVGEYEVKLPIVQILQGRNLISEFVCGSNIDSCLQMLPAAIKSAATAVQTISGADSGEGVRASAVRNLYSEGMLNIQLDSSTRIVLMIHRPGCSKCVQLEPLFHKLAAEFGRSFEWCSIDVADAPQYVSALNVRLTGRQMIPGGDADDCATCSNTGSVSCSECNGIGNVKRGALAVFCPSCCGAGRMRCPSCGGKCLKCEV